MNKQDTHPKTAQAKRIWPHVLPLMEKINVEKEKNMKTIIEIDAVTGERRELTKFSFK